MSISKSVQFALEYSSDNNSYLAYIIITSHYETLAHVFLGYTFKKLEDGINFMNDYLSSLHVAVIGGPEFHD